MALPQMPNMTDTLDFVKNLWGSMGVVPGIAAPTLSVDDLDKKINDLKAVEAWLNLNAGMVRGSIQALEVQRNTIATLKSMGASMAAAMQQQAGGAAPEKPLFDTNPYASALFQSAAEARAPQAEAKGKDTDKAGDKDAGKPAGDTASGAGAAGTGQADAAAAAMAAPSAWWNLLQEQFAQAVATAMSPEAVSDATKAATEAAAKFAEAATQPLAKGGAPKAAEGNVDGAPKAASARKAPVRKAPAKATPPKAGKG